MDNRIEEITDKIHRSKIGLSRYEIEQIVRETAQEIEEKDNNELKKTVVMADPD